MLKMTLIQNLSIILHDKIPLIILINFLLLVFLINLNKNRIKKVFLEIDKKTWIILALILSIASMLIIFVPPHAHIIYSDEQLYMMAGKNMLQTGSQEEYPKSIGWPFVLSIAFGIFGISNWVAIYINILLGVLTIFSIFLLAFIITKRKDLSLSAALLYSLFPINIVWAASAKTNTSSLFFVTLAMFFAFLYYRNKGYSLLWLALISLAFSIQFRFETYILPLLFLFGCILYDKKFFKNINFKFILPWIVLIIFSLPNLIVLINFDVSSPKLLDDVVPGEKTRFSFSNLVYNSVNYGIFIFNSDFQPVLYTVLFIVGFIYMFYKEKKAAIFLTIWFLLFWAILFVPRFQTLGGLPILGKTRYFMIFYPAIIIFAVYGIALIKDLLTLKNNNFRINKLIVPLIIIVLVISFVPHTTKASTWFNFQDTITVQTLETKIPELAEKEIPHECKIIAEMPVVLQSTTDFDVIHTAEILSNKKLQKKIFADGGCVLFFEDAYCLSFCCSEITDEMKNRCESIKKNYDLELYKTYSENNLNYSFYRLYLKN